MTAVPLRSLCQVRHGGTPSKANPVYWSGQIPWVSPKDMKSVSLQDASDHITEEAIENSATSLVPEKSILVVVRSGILAHSLPVAQAARPLTFNQDIKAFMPATDKVDPDYLFWFVRSQEPLVLAQGVKKGATVHSLQSGFIENLKVPLPDRAEQRRIVDLLSRAEGIVRLRREAEKKAAELIPALFVDMFGDPATNPKGWDTVMVKDVLTIPVRNGVSPSKSGTHHGAVLTLSAITRGRFDPLAVKESMFAATISAGDEVCEQDFLVCRGNGNPDLVGAGCFPSSDMPGVAFPDTAIAIRPSPRVFERAYFASVWTAAYVRQQIRALAKTTNGTYKINQAALGSIVLPAPPLDVQRQFGELAKANEGIRALQENARLRAQATFDALLATSFNQDEKAAA